MTNSYGAVITHIEPEHLATVPIPDAPDALKLKIGNLVIRSYTLRDESNTLIDEATKLLIEELKLPAIDNFEVDCFKKDAPVETFNVKLSEMNYRLEASYHVPIVDAIVKHFEKYAAEVTIIGDKRISNNVFLPGRFKRVYVDEGYGRVFFGGKQLFELDPTNTKYLSISKHDKRMKEELELKENLILITRSGTIGKTVLVPKHWENWVASEDVLRIAPASAEMAGYDIDVLRQQSGFIGLTQRQKEQCEECYRELTPYRITSVLESGQATKQIGAYNFVNDAEKISEAIVIILYMLRCCLAHGDISPDESANEVYKYAYEVLCAPLRKLK